MLKTFRVCAYFRLMNKMLVCVFRRLIQSLNGDADKCPSGEEQHVHIGILGSSKQQHLTSP